MKKKNYNVISVLRVLACYLVVRGHYINRFTLTDFIEGEEFITIGAGPVAIFFVISGFLAYVGVNGRRNAGDYYIHRMLKIVPPYYIILTACIVIHNCINLGIRHMGAGWLRYFTFTNMLLPSVSFSDYNDLFGFWTMGCFPIFYFIAPVLVKFMSSFRKTVLLLAVGMGINVISHVCVLAAASWIPFDSPGTFMNLNPFATLYLFIFGMAAAYAYQKSEEKQMAAVLGTVFLIMLIIEKSGYIMWGLASAVICLVPYTGILEKKNNHFLQIGRHILRFLDLNSFYIYLLHLLVFCVETRLSGTKSMVDCIVCLGITLVSSELLRRLTGKVTAVICNKYENNKY